MRARDLVHLPDSTLTNAQAAAYVADGFEIALHPVIGPVPDDRRCRRPRSQRLRHAARAVRGEVPSLPAPVSSRTHCVYWPDWASEPKVELAHGIRMDANYYHYPGSWIGAKPGFMNGGGFPMRFADTRRHDDRRLPAEHEHHRRVDHADPVHDQRAARQRGRPARLLRGLRRQHPHRRPGTAADDEAIIASAQARNVPVISYKQMLDWIDGRNNSTIRSLNWSAGTLTFMTTVGAGANGLQTMLPVQEPRRDVDRDHRGGSAKSYTV